MSYVFRHIKERKYATTKPCVCCKVDFIYASAMPLNDKTYGVPKTIQISIIARSVLLGQYVASLRIAADRGNCNVYIMPFEEEFGNDMGDIADAIVEACDIVHHELKQSDVNVFFWRKRLLQMLLCSQSILKLHKLYGTMPVRLRNTFHTTLYGYL